jgi:hypothetical protein
MPMGERHKTVKLKCPWRADPVDIDAKLAPLIREVWRLGIDTCQCCQERWPGMAEIEFPGTAEAAEFLYFAQQDYCTELERWDEGEDGEHAIGLRLVVHVPLADVPRLVKAFKVVKSER